MVTPCVNDTKEGDIAPSYPHFCKGFISIIQAVQEDSPTLGLYYFSRMGVTDAYHHSTPREYQVRAFVYAIPLLVTNEDILIFPMGWIHSRKYFQEIS